MADATISTKRPLTQVELKKLEQIIKSFSREDIEYMMRFIPVDIVWNEAERRLKEAIEYKDELVNIMKAREGIK